MDIKWLQPKEYQEPYNRLLNSLITLLVPKSGDIIKPLLIDYFKKKNYFFETDLTKSLSGNDLYDLFYQLKKVPFNSAIQKILYIIDQKENSWSFYYTKVNLIDKKIPEFVQYLTHKIILEPKEIKSIKKTNIFAIEYIIKKNFDLLKGIKIQETFENFKINSIYVEIDKVFSIVKIKNKWFIYDDIEGLIPINFTLTKNIISFDQVKIKDYLFCFSNVKSCTLIYLKFKDFEKKIIDPFKECDCKVDLGWRQVDSYCLSDGICWYDASLMALLIPLKSRRLFMDPISKKFNIPKETLFPCKESVKSKEKVEKIIEITKVNAYKDGGSFRVAFKAFYPLISKNERNVIDSKIWYPIGVDIPFYHLNKKITAVPNGIDPKTKIFVLEIFANKSPVKIKSVFKQYELTAIVIGISISGGGHAVAFIKCKGGWYFYDDNLANSGQNMIQLKYTILDNIIDFKPFTYKYSYYSKYDINIDINKMTDDDDICLIYC